MPCYCLLLRSPCRSVTQVSRSVTLDSRFATLVTRFITQVTSSVTLITRFVIHHQIGVLPKRGSALRKHVCLFLLFFLSTKARIFCFISKEWLNFESQARLSLTSVKEYKSSTSTLFLHQIRHTDHQVQVTGFAIQITRSFPFTQVNKLAAQVTRSVTQNISSVYQSPLI